MLESENTAQDTAVQPGIDAPALSLLRRLMDGNAIRDALDPLAKDGQLSIAACMDGRRREYWTGPPEILSPNVRLEIGCIAKNLTALLVAIAVSENLLDYNDLVSGFFPEITGIDAELRVFHLLNHSHGLDGTLVRAIPYTQEERIDATTIWQTIQQVPAISPPGTLFHYHGTIGLWLAASILEGLYQASFTDILRERLFSPLGLAPPFPAGKKVSPGVGGLALSGNELLSVCDFHLGSHGNGKLGIAVRDLRERFKVQLPSWPPIAEGAGPGWFHFGRSHGVFGQVARVSTLMLISPEENAAVVLSGLGGRAFLRAQRLLFGPLISAWNPAPPRLLTRAERASVQYGHIAGRYGRGDLVLEILPTEKAELQAQVYKRLPNGDMGDAPVIVRTLLPADDGTFFPTRPEPEVISFLRFSQPDPDGTCLYATTRRHNFRRLMDANGAGVVPESPNFTPPSAAPRE